MLVCVRRKFMDVNYYVSYTAYLCACVVRNEQPSEMPEDIDLAELLSFSRSHKLENMVYTALSRLDTSKFDKTIWGYFEELWKHAVNNDATQQYYLELVTNALEEHGIDYMIMKGQVLARLYPSTDCRQSGDCDIYVGKGNADEIRMIMERIGFKLEQLDEDGHHDVYSIDKIGLFEMHHDLVDFNYKWEKKISKTLDRLVKVDGCEHRYEMTPEDCYVYVLCHTAKHVVRGGSGIKSMLDIWIYNRCYGDVFDKDRLDERLRYCGIEKFNEGVKKLCNMWFEGESCNEEHIRELANVIAEGGCYGDIGLTDDSDEAKSFAGIDASWARKLRKYFKVTFYPLRWMEDRYPILEKMPFLLPFCWIHRAVNAMFNKRDIIKSVQESGNRADIEKGQRYNKMKEKLGI